MKFCVVTGGRRYERPRRVWKALDRIKPDVVIHGDYGIVDKAAKGWGTIHGAEHSYAAEWDKLGGGAGPRRNRTMAVVAKALREDGHELVCLAFPGGRGTANCIQELEWRGFTVLDGEVAAEGVSE